VERIGVVVQIPRRRAHERVAGGGELRRQIVAREIGARVHREHDGVRVAPRRAVQDAGQGKAVRGGVIDELAAHGGVDRAVAVRQDDAVGSRLRFVRCHGFAAQRRSVPWIVAQRQPQ
jgi:hypothetical protein